jgi:hypothetical protein
VVGPGELAFPDYDGNGMFKSLGQHFGQSRASACCSSTWAEKPRRLARRRHGVASGRDDPLLHACASPGAQLLVRCLQARVDSSPS